MANCPAELHYTPTHEWVRVEQDGTVTVGITDHAQQLLGDVVFVELPEQDSVHEQRAEIAVVESVKTAADVYNPLQGTVLAVNKTLLDSPAMVNQDPYGKGWLFRLTVSDQQQLLQLMSASSYQQTIEQD